MLTNSLRFSHLMKAQILHELPEDQKSRFLDGCEVEFYKNEATIFTQGQAPKGMLLIAHGSVSVRYKSEDGNNTIIGHSRPGDTLGEVEVIAEERCVASCIAAPNTTLLICPQSILFEFLRSQKFLRNLAKIFCDRLARDNTFKSADQYLPVDQRLLKHLVELSEKRNTITQSQIYIAKLAGCSRQTANKILGVLRDQGHIQIRKGAIDVLDRDALLKQIAVYQETQT